MVGYLRPVILMPVGLLTGLPTGQVEAILLHELAHIRRYDYLVNLLQVFVEGLLFYHPAVWWISGVMRTERENCCDDVVVSTTGVAHEYAAALEILERQRISPGMTLAANGGSLVNRVQRLLGRPQNRYAAVMPVLTTAILTVAAITAMAALQSRAAERMTYRVPPAAAVSVPHILSAQAAPPACSPGPRCPSWRPCCSGRFLQLSASPCRSSDICCTSDSCCSTSSTIPLRRLPLSSTRSQNRPERPAVDFDFRRAEVSKPAVRVGADGMIIMPLVTNGFHAAGLLPRELEAEIARVLVDQRILLRPSVTVSISEYATRQINVVGDVKLPGQFNISGSITLLEALAKAGWTTPDAGPTCCLTPPGSETPRTISIEQLQRNTDPAINVTLTGGETVNVPDTPKIWVTGNVGHAQAVPIRKPGDATVLKVIASLNGLSLYYSKTAYIYRADPNDSGQTARNCRAPQRHHASQGSGRASARGRYSIDPGRQRIRPAAVAPVSADLADASGILRRAPARIAMGDRKMNHLESLFQNWVQTPAAATLGRTLLHSLWEGAAVALALAAVLSIARSSRIRYGAACAAMVVLLVGLVVTFARLAPEEPIHIPLAAAGHALTTPPSLFSRQPLPPNEPRPIDDLAWLAPFWIAGVLIFHLRGITSWMAARRLRQTGVCCAPDLLQVRLDQLSLRLRLTRPVALLESCLAEVPVVIGYMRPIILMPVGLLTGLPTGQVEAILLHELAHIRRHDYLTNMLQVFVEGMLFYHPAIWWISGIIRNERENCCDDLVVAVTGGAYTYAQALTALEQRRDNAGVALAATGGSLVNRIQKIDWPFRTALRDGNAGRHGGNFDCHGGDRHGGAAIQAACGRAGIVQTDPYRSGGADTADTTESCQPAQAVPERKLRKRQRPMSADPSAGKSSNSSGCAEIRYPAQPSLS